MKVFCVRRNNFCGGLVMFCELLSARHASPCFRALKTVFIALFCLPALSLAAHAAGQKGWNDLDRVGGTSETRSLQDHLNDWKCFRSNRLALDNRFGPQTLYAWDRWIYNHRATLPTFRTRADVLDYLRENSATSCGPHLVTTGNTCRHGDVGENYIKDTGLKEAENLASPLDFVISNFKTLFPEDKDPQLKVKKNSPAHAQLQTYAAEGITWKTTKDALDDVQKKLKSLTTQYGFNTGGACQICFLINNWRFLKGLALSRHGRLFQSVDRNINVEVAAITIDEMHAVKHHIMIYRRMSKKWISLIDGKKNEYKVNVDDPENAELKIAKTVNITELENAMQIELDVLIQSIRDIKDDKYTGYVKHPGGTARVADLIPKPGSGDAKKYNCIGFDGSTILDSL